MFILVATKSGGVYAAKSKDDKKTVQIFVDKDDAVRYHDHLVAVDFKDELEVMEVELDIVAKNCSAHGYNYCVIDPNQLVIPPP